MAAIERILVVGPSWVGDMVLAQSLFKTLLVEYPQAKIDVLAPAWSSALLARMPEVRNSIPMPLGHGQLGLKARYDLGRSLRAQRYDWAIVLPNSFKSALVPFFAKIPRRTGYRGEMRWGWLNDVRTLDKARLTMTVQRFVALALPRGAAVAADAIPRPKLLVSSVSRAAMLQRLDMALPQAPVLSLCPGAEYGPAKQWPAEYYGAIAKEKIDAGWQVWVLGSQRDAAIAAAVCATAGQGCVNLAGRTELADVIDLLALSNAVVSNDSGLMHVAAAVERPLVAIYGSSDPSFTPPMNPDANILHLNLACSPCFKRTCPYGHFRCLREIAPQQVLALLPH